MYIPVLKTGMQKFAFSMNVGLAGGMEAVVLWYVFQPMNSTIVQLSNGAIGKFIHHFMHPAFFIHLHREQFVYSCGRCSPIWRVSQEALGCSQRPRTASLAQPKRTHPLYIPARDVRIHVKFHRLHSNSECIIMHRFRQL